MMTEAQRIEQLELELELAIGEIKRLRHLLGQAKTYVTDPILREVIEDAGGAM